MAKKENTEIIVNEVQAKKDIIKLVLKRNPEAGAKEIQASGEWVKMFGADKTVGGRLLGNVKEELGLSAPKAAGSGKAKGKAKASGEGPITLEDIQYAKDFLANEFQGDSVAALDQLEAIAKVGSIERMIEAIKAFEDIRKD